MAIAYDNSSEKVEGGSVSSTTLSHTVGTGSARYLVVGTVFRGGANLVATAVTYNGVAMTKIGSDRTNAGACNSNIWGLVNPASGTNDVVVTYSGTGNTMLVVASSYTGVHQTNPVDNNTGTTGTGTTFTASLTPVAGNCWSVTNVGSDAKTPTFVSGISTVRQTNSTVQLFLDSGASLNAGVANALDFSQSSGAWSYEMVTLAPAASFTVSDTCTGTDSFSSSVGFTILETITASEVVSVAKALWSRIKKHITTWTNQNKS